MTFNRDISMMTFERHYAGFEETALLFLILIFVASDANILQYEAKCYPSNRVACEISMA